MLIVILEKILQETKSEELKILIKTHIEKNEVDEKESFWICLKLALLDIETKGIALNSIQKLIAHLLLLGKHEIYRKNSQKDPVVEESNSPLTPIKNYVLGADNIKLMLDSAEELGVSAAKFTLMDDVVSSIVRANGRDFDLQVFIC